MNRRAFITLLGGVAAAWPLAARGQQAAVPVVGLLRSTVASGFEHVEAALRQGLNEEGFIEGRNVVIEYRHADNQHDLLPGLTSDLVRREVAAIVANSAAARVAKTVTTTIPIVFVSGEDPVRSGLVESLNRPGGNVTGVSFFTSPLWQSGWSCCMSWLPTQPSSRCCSIRATWNPRSSREMRRQQVKSLGDASWS